MRSAVVVALRSRLDAIETMSSLGRRRLTDGEHLEFAAAEGWTILTFDTGDFARLHWQWIAAGRSHAGIILETNSLISVGEMLRRSGRLFDRFEGQSIAGQLVYL